MINYCIYNSSSGHFTYTYKNDNKENKNKILPINYY